MSTDPALGEYILQAPINDEAKKANGNLPGMGGVFNVVNLHLYHYAGNNPIKYIDPDGRFMKILISKSRGTMDVVFTNPGSDTKLAFSQSVTVVTNVVQNEQCPGSSTKSDTSRRQSNETNPTQVANGEY